MSRLCRIHPLHQEPCPWCARMHTPELSQPLPALEVMSKATVTFRELRFVIGDDLTHVYVHCEAGGDCPLGVQGWHYKAFPQHYSASQILDMMFAPKSPLKGDDPVLWPQKAPEERLEEWYRVHE